MFILENGTGVANANAYASPTLITEYLTDRGRETENSWSTLTTAVQQAKSIAATDYIENRFRDQFKGRKYYTSLTLAKATLTLTANPLNGETVTIGSRVYTFNTTLGGANSIQIATTLTSSLDNLIAAINGDTGEGLLYGAGTTAHADVFAGAFELDTLVAEAQLPGSAGNLLVSTTTVTGATWSSATLLGGNDVGRPQPLSFPRLGLYDRDGNLILGIPTELKFACAEYAVRAVAGVLQPDPVALDDSGLVVVSKREKVGPIEDETQYHPSGQVRIVRSYPAADALLRGFIFQGGIVERI